MKYTLMLIFTLFSGETEMYPMMGGFETKLQCNIAALLLRQNKVKVVTLIDRVRSTRTQCVMETRT